MNPQNRVVILTGATEGIGRATAYVLAEAGCKLALAARRPESLHTLAAELTAAGRQAVAIPTDMGDMAQAAALASKTVEAFGRIDVVINNAGIGLRDWFMDMAADESRRMMDVNYFGPI